VRAKTCSYSCIYCRIGRTPVATIARAHYVAAERVIHELGEAVPKAEPDHITLSGSGEPPGA